MARSRVATRLVWHVLALGVILLSTRFVRPTNDDMGAQLNRFSQGGPLMHDSAPPALGDETDPTHVTVLSRVQFPDRVERWRGISRDAARTAQRVTGVQLNEDLLLALVAVESEGDPNVRSAAGAIGLAQVMPSTFADLRAQYGDVLPAASLKDPRVNLVAGALYLAHCTRVLQADLADSDQLALVLHAYNMGPRAAAEVRDSGAWTHTADHGGRVQRRVPSETTEHSRRMMAAMHYGGI